MNKLLIIDEHTLNTLYTLDLFKVKTHYEIV